MRNPLILSFILFHFIIGCHQDNNSESRKILKESIAIHDEVMPKMGEMMSLQKELKTLLLKFENDPEKTGEINRAIANLDSAHEGMMNWMRNMKGVPKHDNEDHADHGDHNHERQSPHDILEIQKAQMEEIVIIKKDIINSIEFAKSCLK